MYVIRYVSWDKINGIASQLAIQNWLGCHTSMKCRAKVTMHHCYNIYILFDCSCLKYCSISQSTSNAFSPLVYNISSPRNQSLGC